MGWGATVGLSRIAPAGAAASAAAQPGTAVPLYARHFGLDSAPFSIAPDPRYLFMSERHRDALAHLLYGLDGGGGFVLLTGEIGAGKTTLCRCMLEQVPPHCNVAYIFNPRLSTDELLETVCEEFGIAPGQRGGTLKAHVDALNEHLLRSHAQGQINVLVIDEAQNLSAAVLEQLRLLTNLETSERKLLQIMLVGQPELRTMLAAPGLEQLAQRVIARYHLQALSPDDVGRYVQHRLQVAGLRGALPFDRAALARVSLHSRGVARRINLLCDRALLGAYAEGSNRIGARIVDKAAGEVFDVLRPVTPRRRAPVVLAAGLASLGVAGFAVWQVWPWPQPTVVAKAPVRPAPPPAPVVAAAKPAPVPQPQWLNPDALAPAAETPAADEAVAWQALGAAWGLDLPVVEPCVAAARQGVACFRDAGSNLALIRQLARPGILTLYNDHGQAVRWLLLGFGRDSVVLCAPGGEPLTVSLASLVAVWRGEFATLWRVPPDYRPNARGADADAGIATIAARLAALPQAAEHAADQTPREAIAAFQLANGLKPDGKPGPLTLMHLNRVSGVDEPRLDSLR
ncbi:AAA family ATPase [Niveibacterium sp.]|uniref:ExeA family protein n=1 Tax=Niveibacterium sp. TaxID=2017444 RepID=UPI0035B0A530